MKKRTLNSNYIMILARVLVVLAGIFSWGNGCKNPAGPDEVVNKFAGTWKLTYSTHQEDSIYIGKAFLEINKDSTFTCNVSFFLRRDSLKSQSISGTWSYFEPSLLQEFVSNGRMSHGLSFKSDTIVQGWSCSGDVSSGDLKLIREYSLEYRWQILKGN